MKNQGGEKPEHTPDAVHSNNGRSGGFIGFKKRSGKSNVPTNDSNYFWGLSFKISMDRPNLYEKTIDWLALYSSTQFKNWSDMVAYLRSKEYLEPEVPVLPNNPFNNNHTW